MKGLSEHKVAKLSRYVVSVHHKWFSSSLLTLHIDRVTVSALLHILVSCHLCAVGYLKATYIVSGREGQCNQFSDMWFSYICTYVCTRAETICQLVILHIAIATSNIAIYCIIAIIFILV